MRYCWPLLLAMPLMWAGCNSNSGNNRSADTSEAADERAAADGDPYRHRDTPQETGEHAAGLLATLQLQLESDLAQLRDRVKSADSDEQKQQIYARDNPVPAFVEQTMRLARAFPETDAGLQAALLAFGYAEGPARDRAMNFLLDECSDRLDHAQVIQSLLAEVPGPLVEQWLRKLVATAPPGIVQAQTMLGFKTYFDQIPEFRAALKSNPQVARRLPDTQLAYINAELTDRQFSELEQYLQTVIDEYGDLAFDGQRLGSGDTYGDVAEQELFELRFLGVGKMAPEIIGEDLDGEPFRLSDYRGKVVMLDFWGHWCPPCRRMYPHERHIVRTLSGLPFALVGVNSDRSLETAKNSVRDDKLPWRNFWNGPEGTAGPIARQWSISQWPTIYLIDGQGVIRYKGIQGEDLNQGIELLMAEQGHSIDLSHAPLATD